MEIDPDETYTELGVRSFYKGTFHRRTINGAEFTWQKLFRIHQGDLVFSNLMAWEQAIAVAQDVDHQCVGNHRMLTCEIDASRCTPNFLLYYFTTDAGFAQVLDASPGSIARNKTLSAVQLPKLVVPLPSLESQLWFDELQAKGVTARAHSAEAAAELGHLIPAMLNQVFYRAKAMRASILYPHAVSGPVGRISALINFPISNGFVEIIEVQKYIIMFTSTNFSIKINYEVLFS